MSSDPDPRNVPSKREWLIADAFQFDASVVMADVFDEQRHSVVVDRRLLFFKEPQRELDRLALNVLFAVRFQFGRARFPHEFRTAQVSDRLHPVAAVIQIADKPTPS